MCLVSNGQCYSLAELMLLLFPPFTLSSLPWGLESLGVLGVVVGVFFFSLSETTSYFLMHYGLQIEQYLLS